MTGKGFRPRRIDLARGAGSPPRSSSLYFLLIVGAAFRGAAVVVVPEVLLGTFLAGAAQPHSRPYRFIFTYPNLARSRVEHADPFLRQRDADHARDFRHLLDRRPDQAHPDAGSSTTSLPAYGLPRLVLGLSIMIFYLNFDIGIYGTIWISSSLRHSFHALRLALQHDLDAADPQGARGIGGNEWRVLGHHVSPHHPAALEARARRGLDLRDDRLDPRALQLDPALQPGTESCRSPSGNCGRTASTLELSALGVLFILALFVLVMLAQWLGKEIRSQGVIRRIAC